MENIVGYFSNNRIQDSDKILEALPQRFRISKDDAKRMEWSDVPSGKKVVFVRKVDGLEDRVFVAEVCSKPSFIFHMSISLGLKFLGVHIFLVDENFSVFNEEKEVDDFFEIKAVA